MRTIILLAAFAVPTLALAARPACRVTGCNEAELAALCGGNAPQVCPEPVCPTPVCPVPQVTCPEPRVTFAVGQCRSCKTRPNGTQVCHRCTVQVLP